MNRPENLKPLTTMRFFAAAWVVLYHYWPLLVAGEKPALVARGYLGVELFFVLSGFILSHVYLESFGARTFSYGRFLWARLARIYPVHLAILAGLVGLILGAQMAGLNVGSNVVVWSSIPAQLTLTQAWGFAPLGGWNHPSWSISAEWFAYLAFPAFAAVAWPLRNRPWLAFALASGLVIALNLAFGAIAGFPLTQATIAWGALRIVPCFALGCATWLLWRKGVIAKVGMAKTVVGAAVLLAAFGAGLGLADPAMVLIFGGLILGLGALASTGSKLLSSRLGVYLGEVSFAVYMVCIPWELVFSGLVRGRLAAAEGPLPAWLWVILFVGVVPAAMAAHHLVELPARGLMRAWEQSGFKFPGRGRLTIEQS